MNNTLNLLGDLWDQMYHLTLRNTTTRTLTPLEYYTLTSNIYENNTFVRNVIIEGAPHENKMAGKGQVTS